MPFVRGGRLRVGVVAVGFHYLRPDGEVAVGVNLCKAPPHPVMLQKHLLVVLAPQIAVSRLELRRIVSTDYAGKEGGSLMFCKLARGERKSTCQLKFPRRLLSVLKQGRKTTGSRGMKYFFAPDS